MPRNSQASSKRAKTHNEDAQRPHDLSEERSQVAGLVEKRRLQNRISQRNYRNRIRDRLEALEALVDTTTTGHSMNPSQPSDNARFTSSENADRSTDGAQSLPLETSSILSTENFHTWNTANLQNSSSAQTSGMYHFMDPCLSVDGYQQAKTGAATTYSGSVSSTGASTPASYPYPAPTSAHPFRNQSVITKLEELDSSMRFSPPFENENSPNHPSPSDTSPQTPVDHSASSNTLTFGYPMTPMSMASQQQTPKSFPAQLDHQESNSYQLGQGSTFPFSMQPGQPSDCLSSQQYVWLPVPVAALPTSQHAMAQQATSDTSKGSPAAGPGRRSQ